MEKTMTGQLHPPIFRRPISAVVPENRFEGDLLERENLARRLTGFLSRFPDGAVLAIDSPWGGGKTWFGRRWRATLADEGYRTAYIDCFQRDHVDDPFSLIASHLIELGKDAKPEVRTKLLEASKKLGVALIPMATKLVVNTFGHWAIGNAELAEDLSDSAKSLNESAADSLEKMVAKRLSEFDADRKTIDAFKVALTELATDGDKPIVIFLDELDRCRPDFAVRTIEKIKHFFDVQKVVFVLLMNRKQMAAAIEGMYGTKVDSENYLAKFIQLSLTLPKRLSLELHSHDDNRRFCEATLARYGFKATNELRDFATGFGIFASYFNFSFRDIERAATLFSFGQPIQSSSAHLAWPIALKLARPDLFSRLLLNNRDAHLEAYKLALEISSKIPDLKDFITLFAEIHNAGSQGFTKNIPEEQARMLSGMSRLGGPKQFFTWLFEHADLSVSP